MASGQQGDGMRQANDMFAIGLLLFVFLGGLATWWYFRHTEIVRAMMKTNYWLLFGPAWISGKLGVIEFGPANVIREVALAYRDASQLSFGRTLWLTNKSYMILYPALFLLWYMRQQALGHAILRVRTKHGFWSLMDRQARVFHYIVPVVRFEKYWNKHPEQRKKWRKRAEMPDEWAVRHNLIVRQASEIRLNVDVCRDLFRQQLVRAQCYRKDGKLYNPLKRMTDYERALFVVFASRIVGGKPDPKETTFRRGKESRKAGQDFLKAINLSCVPGNDPRKSFTYSEVAQHAESFIKSPIIANLVREHSYVKTLLMRMLFESRHDGKLPCSWFVWLKLVDRELWYALQGVTYRQINRNFVESAAICAEFWAELTVVDNGMVLKGDQEPVAGLALDTATAALEHVLLGLKVITSTSELYDDKDF